MEGSIHVVGGAYGALRLSLLVEYPGELKVILWEQNILGFVIKILVPKRV